LWGPVEKKRERGGEGKKFSDGELRRSLADAKDLDVDPVGPLKVGEEKDGDIAGEKKERVIRKAGKGLTIEEDWSLVERGDGEEMKPAD